MSKGLATGYAASLSKHELAKQLIHHAASWKPTKLGAIVRERQIDIALAVAWKAIVSGTWKAPLELAKAEILQYEFRHYRRKYQELGILAHEVKSLEADVNNLLGGRCNLVAKITNVSKVGDHEIDFYNRNNQSINVVESGDARDSYVSTRVYANGAVGLESGKNDILNIDPLNKEMLLSANYPLRKEEEENDNYKLEQDIDHLVVEQNSSWLDSGSKTGNNETDKQADYLIDYREPATEQCNRRSLDLSQIPEQHKYLKVIASDNDDSMRLESITGKEYFVKLKELEMNDLGEFVMTLKHVKDRCFIDLRKNIEENYLPVKKKLQELTSQLDLNLNYTDNL